MFLNVNIKQLITFFTFIKVIETKCLILIKRLTKTRTYLYVILIKILDDKEST